MSLETHVATKKDHRCDLCGRRIPIGARYWTRSDGGWREHTNCEDYTREPELPQEYNRNRSGKP